MGTPGGRRLPRWALLVLLAFVLVVGVAIGVGLRPILFDKQSSASHPPSFTDQQVADAKARVCVAYEKVHHAVVASSAVDRGTDPTAQLAFVLNARQVLLAGHGYLLTEVTEEPATPPELATAVRKLADLFQELTIDYLSDASDSEIDQLRHNSDEETVTIERLCK
jgi:hypothetical protein